jgi:DeoR/GlpR family transcriptional regulator of sugar metabolism
MIAEARQVCIEAILQKVGVASLEDLARECGVSVSTVRRDVAQLEAAGTVARTHGGARLVQQKSDEYAFVVRNQRETVEKDAIGRACAELIVAHETVILDAGSTVAHVAQHLGEKPLQIITNSLPVVNLFASAPQSEIVVAGGVIYPRLGVVVGPQAVETFAKAHADVAVLGASGITVEGIFNSHGLLIDIQQAMLRAARRVIFCLDHTKFDRRSMFFLCELARVGTLVTDAAAPPEFVGTLRGRGVEVIVAGAPAAVPVA